jgi:hypothetical protein
LLCDGREGYVRNWIHFLISRDILQRMVIPFIKHLSNTERVSILVMLLVILFIFDFEGILMDFKERTLSFYLNDIFQGISHSNVNFQEMRIAVSLYDELDEIELLEKSEFPSYLPSSWNVEDKFENIKVEQVMNEVEYSFKFYKDDTSDIKSKKSSFGNKIIEKQNLNCVSNVVGKIEFNEGRHYWEVEILDKYKTNWVIGVVNFEKLDDGMNSNFTDFEGYVSLK